MSTNEKLVVYMTPDSQEFALQLARKQLESVTARAEMQKRCLPTMTEEGHRLAAEASDLAFLIKDLESASGEVV